MPAEWEFDTATKKGTLWLKKGGQVITTKSISGNTVNFDSGGEMVSVIFPNPLATVNLASLPFKHDDHVDAIRVMDFHRIKSGG